MGKIEDCIIVAGDFCAVPQNVAKLALADVEAVFETSLLELLQSSNGNILNLETPLTDEVSPIVKDGPCLRSPAAVVDSLAKLNLFGVGLANNHVLDQGIKGFDDTLEVLCVAGIPVVGGGRTLNDSRKSLITEIKGVRIGIYACAEHEFTIAGVDSPGANPFDPFDSMSDVRALVKQVDIVVVLYHGLKEYYRYPSPQVMKRCRAFVEAGAAFVTCQHSHCVGCMESYMGGTILYGQGDFCFCRGDENPMCRDGLLASVDLHTGEVSFLPIVNEKGSVRLADNTERMQILKDFEERSEQITDPSFVERQYEEFCLETIDDYVVRVLLAVRPSWIGNFARVMRKIGLPLRFATGSKVSHLLNMLQCEAHRELVITALKRKLDE